MSYEVFFSGVGGIILGSLLGSWITAHLTYGFQKKLLMQQLEAQRKSDEEKLKYYTQVASIFETMLQSFNVQMNQLKGYLSRVAEKNN